MKILLSAYACEPNKGSEPGVGWSWAIEYAKYHQVWVLTRDNNEQTITAYLRENPEYDNKNLHFVYVGLPKKLTFWKKGRRGMRLFYMLWQRKAVRIAIEWNKKIHFDLVQHVTFVSYTQPTYMFKLGVPLIWGPVSGGENIPIGIKLEITKKEAVVELLRTISQYCAFLIPSIRKTMKAAHKILVTTQETKTRIPKHYINKTTVLPAISLEKIPDVCKKNRKDGKIKIIMAGRLIYWKGFDIAINGFMSIADKYPNAELHILGDGNQKKRLKELSQDKLGKQVFFEKPVNHDEIFDLYSNYDFFINTTLRDSGCMTLMEAMSVGLPCIAIATGGPAILLKSFEECKILPTSYESCVSEVAAKIEDFILKPDKWKEIAEQQRQYAIENFVVSSKIGCVLETIEQKVDLI